MSATTVLIVFLGYLGILFLVAYWTERHPTSLFRRTPYNYALSLTVFCTAWTFLGSVGKAANDGLAFLPVYLGPVMLAPLWPTLIGKIIRISKAERLTSLADFLSSRFGKSRSLGVLAATFLVISIVPYISIQLKAMGSIFDLLIGRTSPSVDQPFFSDSALLLTLILALFVTIFGVRRLDPNERHDGVIAAISFEAVFKIIAFLIVGLFVTFGIFNGPGDLFGQAAERPEIKQLWSFSATGMTGWDWFWLNLISMCAVVLLPRQFHVAVTENESKGEVKRAAWFFPLYLLLINLFIIPIAIGGLLIFGSGAAADSFVISLPNTLGYSGVALVAGLGGFSAATGMVIMSTIALSLMISNNIFLPFVLQYDRRIRDQESDLSRPLLNIRKLIIFLVLILAYGYYKSIATQHSLVMIGLISFVAVSQFAPPLLSALYWKGAHRKGATLGLVLGFLVWGYTLALPTLTAGTDWGQSLLDYGPWQIAWLRPEHLFGSTDMSVISHGAFWSLMANVMGLVAGSLVALPTAIDIKQADYFVDHHKYRGADEGFETLRRSAKLGDLQSLLARFTGKRRANKMIRQFAKKRRETLPAPDQEASQTLLNYVEQQLSGAIGAASAQILLRNITREESIQLEEVITILQRTREAIRYGKVLERKQAELEDITARLRSANLRLQELDRLKADFISTVTHELRTPITSIKSLANILHESPELSTEQRTTFLQIIVSESERLARLVGQVLDVQRLEAKQGTTQHQAVLLNELVDSSAATLNALAREKDAYIRVDLPDTEVWTLGPPDRLTQVMVNLIGNAIKFVPNTGGIIEVSLHPTAAHHQANTLATIRVADNGPGVPERERDFIFERFTQLQDSSSGKPAGSGLGLYISRRIVEQCGGGLYLDPEYHQGAAFLLRLPVHLPSTETQTPLTTTKTKQHP